MCTRICGFCSVSKGTPWDLDLEEPMRIARAVRALNLEYVVITSVTRDDIEDGGASQFVGVIEAIRNLRTDIKIEVLTPDFEGKIESIRMIVDARPDVFGHNIETLKRLYQIVRPDSDYERSLKFLKTIKEMSSCQATKSGIMVGLGETEGEVVDTMMDLRSCGCDILTIGQYLQPTGHHIPVERFIEEAEFERYKEIGYRLGFNFVSAGPFVRSSYLAEDMYRNSQSEAKGNSAERK